MKPTLSAPPSVDRNSLFEALETCQVASGGKYALLITELHNLKAINHRYGYETGDLILSTFGERFEAAMGDSAYIVRIGGNQFAALLKDVGNSAYAIMICARAKVLLSKPVTLDDVQDTQVQLLTNVGFTLFEHIHSRAEATLIFNEAERSLDLDAQGLALHEHEQHRGRLAGDAPELIDEFLLALQANEFELFYQPKLNLASGYIDRVEALMRWRIPGLGMISPLKMLQCAERSGTLFALSKWVTFTAVRQVKEWLDQGLDLKVAINLPADLVDNPETVDMVKNALAIWQVPGSAITLEITESAVMADKNSGQNNLIHLRELGIEISIDDFGTGFSSLSYFKDIPADELKIDRSFVLNMSTESEDRNIVELILRIANLFKLSVVAEGVEDQTTLDLLAEMGCDYAQGYHIARPMPADDLLDWFDSLEA